MTAELEHLQRLEAKIDELLEDRAHLMGVLESAGEALSAMAEQLQAISDALFPEEGDEGLHSLDGDLEGAARDPLQPLDDAEELDPETL